MDASFIQARIAATKTQIIAYEDAITAIATDGVQSYDLDTGQSVQKVTKLSLPGMQRTLDSLYNRCTMLEQRLSGGSTAVGGPAW